MLGAVVFGHEQMQAAIKAINELKARSRQARVELAAGGGQRARSKRRSPRTPKLRSSDAYKITDKQARRDRIQEIKEAALAGAGGGDAPAFDAGRRREGIRAISNTASCVAACSPASRASTAAT